MIKIFNQSRQFTINQTHVCVIVKKKNCIFKLHKVILIILNYIQYMQLNQQANKLKLWMIWSALESHGTNLNFMLSLSKFSQFTLITSKKLSVLYKILPVHCNWTGFFLELNLQKHYRRNSIVKMIFFFSKIFRKFAESYTSLVTLTQKVINLHVQNNHKCVCKSMMYYLCRLFCYYAFLIGQSFLNKTIKVIFAEIRFGNIVIII